MNNKIVKSVNNTPVKMTRDIALERLEEAKELLKVSYPKELNSNKDSNKIGCDAELISLWIFSVLSVGFSLISVPFGILSTPGVVTLGLAGVSFAIGIPFFQTRALPYFNNDKKVRKMLSRVFLSKKQQERLRRALTSKKENSQTMEIYRLLVEKVTKELEYSGVFEIINDFNDPLNQSFVTINQSTGSFDYVSRRVVEDEMAKKREKDSALDYNKSMLTILSDDTQLLGQGRVFKEMF